VNKELFMEIKEEIHTACESEDSELSNRAFALLAIFDALDGTSDGSMPASDLVSAVLE